MTGFQVEILGSTAVVTIDRPKANAIDAATSKAMGDAFASLDADPVVRAIILTGAGPKFFSAGWDLSAGEEFDSDYGVGGFGGFPELAERSTPVIAAVNGMAVGGGFEIAMAADLIIAAEHAQFWLPEPAIGILPDAGSVKLPRLLPPHVARDLMLTGRRMAAAEGHRWGLIARVVAADELLSAAHQVAAAVAGLGAAQHCRAARHRAAHGTSVDRRGRGRPEGAGELSTSDRFRGRRRRPSRVRRASGPGLEGSLTTRTICRVLAGQPLLRISRATNGTLPHILGCCTVVRGSTVGTARWGGVGHVPSGRISCLSNCIDGIGSWGTGVDGLGRQRV